MTRTVARLILVCFVLLPVSAALADIPSQVLDQAKQAQDVGPFTCSTPAGSQACVDTEATPIAKPSPLWKQVAGAVFPQASDGTMDPTAKLKVISDSEGNPVVPVDVDFFTLAIRDQSDAYAGGSQCEDPVPADKTSAQDVIDYVRTCTRVPVIYHYSQPDPDHVGAWSLEYRGDAPGYVGGVAYTTDGLVVAAGGSGLSADDEKLLGPQIGSPESGVGAYPYREDCGTAAKPCPTGWTDEAGSARVWEKQDGSATWCEAGMDCGRPLSGPLPTIANPDGTKSPMSGLTALDCSPRTADGGLCIAGGMGQLWMWQKGGFTHGIDTQTAATEVDASNGGTSPQPLRYRVRKIRFVPGLGLKNIGPTIAPAQAFAVTAGCCSSNPADDMPDLLSYDANGWHDQGSRSTGSPDSYYSLFITTNPANPPDAGPNPIVGGYGTYLVAAAGGPVPGPEDPPEPSSDPPGLPGADQLRAESRDSNAYVPADPQAGGLGTARIVDVDGDLSWSTTGLEPLGDLGVVNFAQSNGTPGGDGIPDWGAGSTTRTGQGLAWTSTQGGALTPSPVSCPNGGVLNIDGGTWQDLIASLPNETKCSPKSPDQIAAQTSTQSLMLLTSFSLNAFSEVYSGTDRTYDEGEGWAVGDRGAIEHIGGAGSTSVAGKRRPAAVLGSPEESATADTPAYGVFQPTLSAVPGLVPSLQTRPLVKLPSPEFVAAGIPDATRQGSTGELGVPPGEIPATIVMSRDGSEGWALGSWDAISDRWEHPVLYHYLNGDWRRCDPDGTRGPHGETLVPADPACAGLARFIDTPADKNSNPVTPFGAITSATRVPLERGSDPSLANQFEVIAVGVDAALHPVVLRYRAGRWSLDQQGSAELASALPGGTISTPPTEMAFAAPDDGWIAATETESGSIADPLIIFHYDGRRWIDCSSAANARACGDPRGELQSLTQQATGVGPFRLAVAGSRVYLSGSREVPNNDPTATVSGITSLASRPATTPVIIYEDHDRGGVWTDAPGGLDRGFDNPNGLSLRDYGEVNALSVTANPDGSFSGWALGAFGPPLGQGVEGAAYQQGLAGAGAGSETAGTLPPSTLRDSTASTLLRLDGSDCQWCQWVKADASADLVGLNQVLEKHDPTNATVPPNSRFVALADGSSILIPYSDQSEQAPELRFDPARQEWSVLGTPFGIEEFHLFRNMYSEGAVTAAAPDNSGGAWLAAVGAQGAGALTGLGAYNSHDNVAPVQFYHYTDTIREPVFQDVAHPIREVMTAAAGGPDGSFWVATDSGAVYRYSRIGGWEKVAIKGWDAGIVTTPSPAYGIAVGADGHGLVVGKQGRIADLFAGGVRLDPAAGTVCDLRALPILRGPCGTSENLRAAALAPDGSALVAGDSRALLWRPYGQQFRAINPPPAAHGTTFTAVALLSRPSLGFVATDDGRIYSGLPDPNGNWTWHTDVAHLAPDLTARDPASGIPTSKQLGFLAMSIASDGHGYAVGTKGLVFERLPTGVWRRVDTGFTDNFSSVALGPGDRGALIGGEWGRILTLDGDSSQVAREPDRWDPYSYGDLGYGNVVWQPVTPVVGVALAAGPRPGEVEAWAASQLHGLDYDRGSDPPGVILHYASDSDPLLNPQARVKPLPDSPPPRPGELTFAAFGKSDCQVFAQNGHDICPAPRGSNAENDVILGRIVDALESGVGARFALYTGDVNDQPGTGDPFDPASTRGAARTPLSADLVHRDFADQIAAPLAAAGTPLFAALGGQDLDTVASCVSNGESTDNGDAEGGCPVDTSGNGTGTSVGWRQAFAGMPAPWGEAPAASGDGFSYVPVGPTQTSIAATNQSVTNPQTGGQIQLPTGGAATHYAFDVVDEHSRRALARVVVVDTSLRTLAGSAVNDQPRELTSQLLWLKSVLCIDGDPASAGQSCSRQPSEQAIVVSEAPTYSYGPATSDTEQDGQTLEGLMQTYRVNVVVSGRLGWNGLYWALAPGVHDPCPGGAYPDPSAVPLLTDASPCSSSGSSSPQGPEPVLNSVEGLAAGLSNGATPTPPARCDGSGPNPIGTVPYVIAASAGGKSGAADSPATGSADQGFWHGYTLIRLDRSGDPDCTIIETRPILDWVGIDAVAHALAPGQHLQLRGYGREPAGYDMPVQYDSINSYAITHRYDLVEADPSAPWVPLVDPASPAPNHYVPLDPSVGTINPITGFVQTGSGSHPLVYAIAILSVGDKAASWPIAFEPRRSFVSHTPILPQLPPAIPPITVPPVHLAAAAPSPPPPPQAAPPTPPEVATPNLPQLPNLIPPPPLAGVTPPSPPPAPAPPPPPSQPAPLPLALQAKLSPVGINATVIPPSPPPVNPAPPSGSAAKKEARQRQAATAKSEEGGQDSASEGVSGLGGDRADGPPVSKGAAMTRHGTDGRHAFTALAHPAQPSAWARDALYGGGIGIAALVLALGFTVVRPTPRRRSPSAPVPAWARLTGPRERR